MSPAGAVRRIGLLGGAFDPPHVGHLVVARDALERMALDEVRLVVTGVPPHKGPAEAPAESRARMVEASLEDEDGLIASRIELERPGPSWTVETLRALRTREPGVDWHLLIGADQLEGFHRWREPEAIVGLARLVAMGREGRDPRRVGEAPGAEEAGEAGQAREAGDPGRPGQPGKAGDPGPSRFPYDTVDVTRLDISSTRIRNRIRAGRSVRWLVPAPALRIIEDEGLYAVGPADMENGTHAC